MNISFSRKFIVLAGAILLLFALFLGETALLRVATVQRGEIEKELRIQEMALRRQVMAKTRLVERYKQALVELERFPLGEPGDLVTLFANIEGEMAKNGLAVDSIRPVGLDPKTMTATTEVAFRGNFFSVMRTMADWRNGMQPIQLSTLSIRNEPIKNEPKAGIGSAVSAKAVLVSKVKPAQEGGK
jgi:hypothetical protein